MDMTHAELVTIAARWLKRQGCNVVLTERGGASTGETPDAMGWWCSGFQSAVIECKTSVEDFYADRRKEHRDARSLGSVRWYLAPIGVIAAGHLTGGWGLLEWDGRVVRRSIEPEPWRGHARSIEVEAQILLSELRIFHAQGITYRKGAERWGTNEATEPAEAHS